MKIKVKSFIGSEIVTEFAGRDLWRLKERAWCNVSTSEGVLRYTMLPGFLTDMRSGSHSIDPLIPKFTGNNGYNLAILVHDFNYTRLPNGDHPVSKEAADDMLEQMCLLSGQLGSARAKLMKWAVSAFGKSAYCSENGAREIECAKHMKFEWGAK